MFSDTIAKVGNSIQTSKLQTAKNSNSAIPLLKMDKHG
jgi:hypothetical protein